VAININGLASEINRQLALYARQTEETVEIITEKVTNDGVELLKANSPKSPGGGKYASSWTSKKVGKKVIIYNKKYQLTHLLEKGHAKINGGRVGARVHIKPVEDKMIEEFEDELVRGLSE